MFSSGPSYAKLKTNLRLIINRLKLAEKKKTELAAKSRKDIADYIAAGKDDRARIRVEHIIREDYLVEAMELLEMYCDLLLARFGLINTQKELDPGLEEAVASLIWAAPRLQADIQELKIVSDELIKKYGKEFGQACKTNELNNVSEKVMHKLSVQAPPKILVERYMVEIAKTYSVPFEPDPSVMLNDEIFAAENILIDLGEKKGGHGGASGGPGYPSGGGGGGGTGVMQPMPASASAPYQPPPPAMQYPPQGSNPAPALPSYPPDAHSVPSKPMSYDEWLGEDPKKLANSQPAPVAHQQPPPAGFMDLPELPAVPTNTLPDPGNSVGGSSAGGEDVDFDDLTRRFEQLKKKK